MESDGPCSDRFKELTLEYQGRISDCERVTKELHAFREQFKEVLGELHVPKGPPATEVHQAISMLSQREMQVFALLGQGQSTQQIAEALEVGFPTVETYRERLKTKLSVDNATALVRYAVLWTNDCL